MPKPQAKTETKQLTADFLLSMVALVWGLTFVTVKNALIDIKPFTFNAIRFTIAFIFMTLFLKGRGRNFSKKLVTTGAIIGTVLFAGYSFQTIGLQYTTASNAGFITGLSVVLVPIFTTILLKESPTPYALLGAISAALGLGFLSLQFPLQINTGDLLVFFCAVSFALHIVLVGRFSPLYDTLMLVTAQIGTVAFLSGLFAVALERQPVVFSLNVVIALLITAIPATALAYLIQNWAQKFTTATRTAIIFSMEPVFAAIFAVLLLSETMTPRDITGSVLVLTGMLLAELKSQ
ncbi:MAG: DMT family transporter [Thermoanaerobacteraceae bacterium]|nr:DMT family transporter [Thermoanaerobacteraceae bacterium]